MTSKKKATKKKKAPTKKPPKRAVTLRQRDLLDRGFIDAGLPWGEGCYEALLPFVKELEDEGLYRQDEIIGIIGRVARAVVMRTKP